ncbi:hypothetical protein K2173_002171 [Erythroxylum novogranatense]|uniref:Uncharacterized protein n=1 Tax=Erythroxylum novogranatense TaxID=1862640 RepID=A0AAV8SPS2_9ROSI|nr:hypothetical protein K2173_002171 [Erythroxylum novogranatense]
MSDQTRPGVGVGVGDLRTTTTTFALIKQTTATFAASRLTFIFLSLLLFSFRVLVENGTHLLTSFVDRDPSLKSLLSRLDLAGHRDHQHRLAVAQRFPHQHHQHHHHHHRRRRPFLHVTRVGTLDDDFFSGDDDTDRSLHRKLPPNGSTLILNNFDPRFGFSDLIADNGINVPEIVRSGVQFKAGGSEYGDGEEIESEKRRDLERVVDLQFFIKGLELGRRDATALFYLVSFLSVAYGWVILGFTVIYSWILGVVFVVVVNDLLGRVSSIFGIWDGSRMGLKRLTGFILMRWAVRDALTQLVGLWYFGEVEDQYSFFKLFVRLKLMPFSIMSPWVRGFEKEISWFLITWFLLDTIVGFIFAVDAWVTIVDSRRTGREIVREGCYLMSTMFHQAVQLKCIESILCGSAVRYILSRIVGRVLAAVFQSTAEVFFMVAWLIYYLAARCKEAQTEGRRFGRRELEGLIDRLR